MPPPPPLLECVETQPCCTSVSPQTHWGGGHATGVGGFPDLSTPGPDFFGCCVCGQLVAPQVPPPPGLTKAFLSARAGILGCSASSSFTTPGGPAYSAAVWVVRWLYPPPLLGYPPPGTLVPPPLAQNRQVLPPPLCQLTKTFFLRAMASLSIGPDLRASSSFMTRGGPAYSAAVWVARWWYPPPLVSPLPPPLVPPPPRAKPPSPPPLCQLTETFCLRAMASLSVEPDLRASSPSRCSLPTRECPPPLPSGAAADVVAAGVAAELTATFCLRALASLSVDPDLRASSSSCCCLYISSFSRSLLLSFWPPARNMSSSGPRQKT